MVAPVRQELNDGDELRVCNNIFAVVLSDAPIAHQEAPTSHVLGRGSDWCQPAMSS